MCVAVPLIKSVVVLWDEHSEERTVRTNVIRVMEV